MLDEMTYQNASKTTSLNMKINALIYVGIDQEGIHYLLGKKYVGFHIPKLW